MRKCKFKYLFQSGKHTHIRLDALFLDKRQSSNALVYLCRCVQEIISKNVLMNTLTNACIFFDIISIKRAIDNIKRGKYELIDEAAVLIN